MTAALTIERYTDAQHFLDAAQAWLLAAEVDNNLLTGIALNWRERQPTDPPPYWAIIRADDSIVGCACRTPPSPLVLSRAPVLTIAALADYLSAIDPALNGVNGPTAEAEAFAGTWTARHGGRWKTRIRLRLHELTRPPPLGVTPPGSLRKAVDTDLALAREWTEAYVRDTGIQPPTGDMAQRLVERGQLFLWVDAADVRSMVAATRDTGSGCSINTVYTPPRFRGHGYATAAVAALSRRLFDQGRRFCCLYTNVANPTSNAIYAKLGYKPIRDDVELSFER
jgi:predicted GNAT family acetyltransferase